MVFPVVILMVAFLLIYAGLNEESPVDSLRTLLGRPKSNSHSKLFSDAQNSVSGGGGSFAPNTSSASVGSAITAAGSSGKIIGKGKKAYSHLSLGRLDQGVDFGGSGPVGAIADGVVIAVGKWPGWPGIGGIVYHTQYGNVYIMENFTPDSNLRVGDHVKAGQFLGTANGGYPFIETGFANSTGTGPLTPYNGAPDGTPMPGAHAFMRLLGL